MCVRKYESRSYCSLSSEQWEESAALCSVAAPGQVNTVGKFSSCSLKLSCVRCSLCGKKDSTYLVTSKNQKKEGRIFSFQVHICALPLFEVSRYWFILPIVPDTT